MTSRRVDSKSSARIIEITHKPPGIGTKAKTMQLSLFSGVSESSLLTSVRSYFLLAPDVAFHLTDGSNIVTPLRTSSTAVPITIQQPLAPAFANAPPASDTLGIQVASKVEHVADEIETFEEFPNGKHSSTVRVNASNVDEVEDDFLHVGWATKVSGQKKDKKNGRRSWTKLCLGNFECPESGCVFAMRPPKDKSKLAALKKTAKCRIHKRTLVYLSCKARCVFVKAAPVDGMVTLTRKHSGVHQHRHPPPARATPAAKRKFKQLVLASPGTAPHTLQVGSRSTKSVVSLHPAYSNLGTVSAQRRTVLKTKAVNNGFDGLKLWQDESPAQAAFISSGTSSLSAKDGHLFLQTVGMKAQLTELEGPIETDAIESLLDSPDNACVVFSTAFQPILLRVVPIAVCILFGKTKQHYYAYFKRLLADLPFNKDEDGALAWLGMTADFSDAQRQGFMTALEERLVESDISASPAEARVLAPTLLKVNTQHVVYCHTPLIRGVIFTSCAACTESRRHEQFRKTRKVSSEG